MNEIFQKAAAFDELASQLDKQASDDSTASEEVDYDALAEEAFEKAAAFDRLMAGEEEGLSEYDEMLEKAAAYDEYVLDQQAEEIIKKAEAYDELVSELHLEEAMEKAAAYDALLKEAGMKDKVVSAGKRYMELLRGGKYRGAKASTSTPLGSDAARKKLKSESRKVLGARATTALGATGLGYGASKL